MLLLFSKKIASFNSKQQAPNNKYTHRELKLLLTTVLNGIHFYGCLETYNV
jgi:hypothetical protein